METEQLEGGREGIFTDGKYVYRPKPFNATDIHQFLNFLSQKGSSVTPKVMGVSGEEEILSFMPGIVYNELPESLRTDEMIKSAAKLLKNFHVLSRDYMSQLDGSEQWLLSPKEPMELLCHGDFAPYNVTIENNKALGIIDFDTLHPGYAMWDIAYGIYRWASFEAGGDLKEQIRLALLFLEAYETDDIKFVGTLIKRLQALVDCMKKEAASGNENFQENIESGHLQKYLEDIEYLKANQLAIETCYHECR